jgi:hypothetical protein
MTLWPALGRVCHGSPLPVWRSRFFWILPVELRGRLDEDHAARTLKAREVLPHQASSYA